MPQKESLLERASHRPFICELRLYLVNLFVCLFFGKGTCEFVMVQETRATRRGNFHALVIRAQGTDPDSRRCLQTESGHGPCWLKPLAESSSTFWLLPSNSFQLRELSLHWFGREAAALFSRNAVRWHKRALPFSLAESLGQHPRRKALIWELTSSPAKERKKKRWKFDQALESLCSAGWCWWLVLIFCERKILLSSWLVLVADAGFVWERNIVGWMQRRWSEQNIFHLIEFLF